MLNIFHNAGDCPDVLPRNSVVNADCLEVFDKIADASIDMILCDLPYGTTACKWDTVIEFNDYILYDDGKRTRKIGLNELLLISHKKGLSYESTLAYFEQNKIKGLWTHYKRVLKPSGVVVLTASQPFTSIAVMSNLKWFKYDWTWKKPKGTGHLNAKKMPMRDKEDILVFYKNQCIYNPQFSQGKPYKRLGVSKNALNKGCYGETNECHDTINLDGLRYPKQVLEFDSDAQSFGSLHPTQKPIALFKYFIETYTNAGMLVLDNCAGSGTTGAGCIELGRDCILIEKDKTYFNDTIIPRLQNTISAQNSKLFNE